MDEELIGTFLQECRELLEEMESRLLQAEAGECDSDCINAIFRAAHTIKGSAGVFGFEPVVHFTHGLESVLDKVRDGLQPLDAGLTGLLLECGDHLGRLVEAAAAGRELEAGASAAGAVLSGRLAGYLGSAAGPAPAAAATEATEPVAADVACAATDNWHISLRFGRDVLRNGLDPLSFLRYLGTLGEIAGIATLYDGLPAAADLQPEDCYLGFELSFRSDRDKDEIEAVFDFIRDDATIRILPPRSSIDEYVELIAAQPEDDLRLGQILVECGTLTERELAEALAAQKAEPEAARQALGQILVQERMVQPEVVVAALEKQRATGSAAAPQKSTIRVDAERLDQLINLIGELVISGAGVNLTAQRGPREAMVESAATLNRLIEAVRDSALNLRMVQIGDTFNRFQRVVRDVSRQLGKDIRLVIEGAETELDKTVVEKIGDPLMHLVRNAMDHGIESAEARLAAGKPAQGTISLNAHHDAGSIVIEVGDDGGGLSREKILKKAIERGIVAEGQELGEREVFRLIFEAGFSTAEQVSELSGRGVGMDVVRRNIEALRGTVDIDSVPGRGTRMRIRLPLTMAIIDGFLVGVGESAFVIPLDLVVECVELTDAGRSGDYVNLRGQLLPFLRLRDLFGIEAAPPAREQIVIVQFGSSRAGLVVDALHGEFQTVIKPLGPMFSQLSGISGSTIMGSGEVALILDIPRLIQHAGNSVAAA
ncbi:MAG: chemotaxis protein CheA [Rhodocyclaceae bacterium]|nr:chemotaxis protein CheA [Rhodocyclaceae bacterium]